uniref:RRM domain-containing protein n=1 Tax=Meloidogyne hapla TaxID=6305 RepID=A0A1I8BUM7_MELHA
MFRQLSAVCRVSQQVFSRSVRSFSSKVDLPKTSSVHISNLPGETTDEDLRYLFAGYGPVTDIRIKNTYAFVEFGRVEDALYAIKELNCTELQGEMYD